MIELRNVNITAGTFALQQVSFALAAGEHGVLMGQTGQGKTTILEAICGLRQVNAGQIVIGGIDVTDCLPGDRGIGYVPQDLALFPTLSVRQHLEFAMRLRGQSASAIADRVEELSALLRIGKLLDRSVTMLSGGESQRVALGRALSFRPPVLLLDEPFSALDEATRQEMHVLLRTVTAKTSVTTLHVTHSSEEAAALANRRFVLRDGAVHAVDAHRTESQPDADHISV
ncbi:MAG: ABC transporter ATP-binding protein [Planctomycetaceae bacterium]